MTKVKVNTLPEIRYKFTPNHGKRNGAKVQRVVLHTWGGHYTDEKAEAKSYEGVVSMFMEPSSQVSAHFVYPGSAKPNEITQMVRYADYAWTEAAYNPTSVEIECADAIWLGHDPEGMEQLAHIVGWLLHHFKLPPVWNHDKGFCRHGDLGVAGGGHTACPITLPQHLAEWKHFAHLVEQHYKRYAKSYRKTWGK
jgi:N-acetyl-anhydromuramyl-L-alanine amidase AmpD